MPRIATRSSRSAPITPAKSPTLVQARAAHRGPHHQRRRRAPRGLRQPRRRGARRRRNGRGPRRRRHRGDQRRRRVRGAVARHDARARRRPSASTQPADFSAQRHAHRHRCRRASSRVSSCVRRRAPCRSSCTSAGRHNVLNALCAAAAAIAAGASLDDVRAGLATMRPVPGRLQFKTAPSGAWIVDDSYNANPSSMKAGIEVLASVRCAALAGHGRHGRARRVTPTRATARSARFARNHRIDRLFATGKLSALAVEAFGAGGEWFADTEALARAVNAELTREVCVLVKGSRMQPAGARGRGADRQPALVTGPTEHMLYWLAKLLTPHYSGFNVFSYLTRARHLRGDHRRWRSALLLGPWMIEKLKFGKVGQVVRDDGPKSHFSKAGTPTMGGMLILIAIFVSTLLWADLSQPLRLGGARRHVHVRADRLLGRLPEAREEEPQGPDRALQVFLAVGVRAGRRRSSCSTPRRLRPRPRSIYRSSRTSPCRWAPSAFIVLSYFMIVGMSNAVNLTDGLDGLAIMPSVMVGGALGVFAYASGNANFVQYLGIPGRARRGRAADLLRARWSARASGSCGSTPIRRRCSWATSARWRSAPRSARSP